VIANVIVRKTDYTLHQQPYQHKAFYTVKRIQRILGAGMLTMIVIGLITKSIIQPQISHHFWQLFLIISFVVGAFIGDTLQRVL
jgi:hypothetical protein